MKQFNRALAALVSLALIVSGILVIIEVVAARTGHEPVLADWQAASDWASRTTWTQGSVRVVCALLLLLGLALLVAELRPAPVTRLPADRALSDAADIDTAYTRRGVAAAVHSAVDGVDGVHGPSVRVTPRKVTVTATATTGDRAAAAALREPVSAAVRQRLAALQLRSAPSVSVHIHPGSR